MSQQVNEEFELLAAGYFDQTLDDVQSQRFAELLRSDDVLVKRFAELAQLHQMIAAEIAYAKQAERLPNDSGAASAMAELLGSYEDGLDTPIDFATWQETQKSTRVSRLQNTLAGRWFVGGAIAAVLTFVGVLAVVLSGGDATDEQVAEESIDRDNEPVLRVVASLTGSEDAQWMEGAFAHGSELHPGQRLTLTQGFAEITTNDGAVVILEAPATIELLNNNALRLHTGKLVGICETPSSKGFLVRTPHLDVTDLGTRFGVDVSQLDATEVHVIKGLVEVTPPTIAVGAPVRLSAQQAMRVDSVQAERVTFLPSRFE
ncbi:MAG: FecR domain-containing protein, partial [Phycisphaeraceae bacterium]